jgi:hypothetical protein
VVRGKGGPLKYGDGDGHAHVQFEINLNIDAVT